MTNMIALSGSLRRASFNAGLARAAASLSLSGVTVKAMGIHGIPLYDADSEAEDGIPDAVTHLKDALRAADGLLLVTPEYNNGVPGVFKNAIDWASRPASDIGAVFGAKPVAIIGASPGGFGTMLAQNHWLPVIRTLGMKPWFEGRLMVSRASGLFDDDGNLTDDSTREKLRNFVKGFAAFAAA